MRRVVHSGLILPFLLLIFSVLNLSGWFFYYQVRKAQMGIVERTSSGMALVFAVVLLAGIVLLLRNQYKEQRRRMMSLQEEVDIKEKLAVLGELAAGITHDIRTPLGAVEGFAELLGREVRGDAEKEDLVHKIVREVRGLNQIITGFLNLAHPSQPKLEGVDVNQLIERSVSAIEEEAKASGVEVVLEPGTDIPQVRGDAEQLKQAFVNLARNAVQAMPRGGRLTVGSAVSRQPEPRTGPERSSRGEREGQLVTITFRDTGPGIPEEDREKIFKPLFTTRAEGLGLGLAIVRKVVDAHRGRIALETSVGKGSTFTVNLPVGE